MLTTAASNFEQLREGGESTIKTVSLGLDVDTHLQKVSYGSQLPTERFQSWKTTFPT